MGTRENTTSFSEKWKQTEGSYHERDFSFALPKKCFSVLSTIFPALLLASVSWWKWGDIAKRERSVSCAWCTHWGLFSGNVLSHAFGKFFNSSREVPGGWSFPSRKSSLACSLVNIPAFCMSFHRTFTFIPMETKSIYLVHVWKFQWHFCV